MCIRDSDNAYPILKANDQAATFFIERGYVTGGNPIYLDEDDCDTLYADGWDISVHGIDDWTTYDATEWADNVEADRTWIINSGWPRGADFAAYPGGSYDDTVLDRMQTNFLLGRSIDTPNWQKHPSGLDEDYWFLKVRPISTTAATNEGYIDNTIARGGLLIFYVHKVDDDETITKAMFTALSNYLVTKEDDILTLTCSEYLAGRGLSGIQIYYTIIQDCGTSAISLEYAGNYKIYNNNLLRNGSYGLEMYYNRASLAPEIKNNIFWDNGDDSYQIYSKDTAISTDHIMDNNLYYDPDTHTNVIYWEGTARATLAAFVAATDWEDNGVESDPLMTDPGSDDFTLQVGSPCINRGAHVGLFVDYLGLPVPIGHCPDIGAYEHKNGGRLF